MNVASRQGSPERHRFAGDAEMVRVEGGVFHMGADAHYPEEAPVHLQSVESFWIDRTPVTNREFARFVALTGYVTTAERMPDPAEFPGAATALLVPGALVFRPSGETPADENWTAWWSYLPGASWRQPQGPGSSTEGLEEHPVVQVSFADALAYAVWAGKDLPTEAEWEFAARGGLDRAEFAWGDELAPGGVHLANTWQGRFPVENLAEDGYAGTSPVMAFPPNGHGIFDMIGNAWEWTRDSYRDHHGGPGAPSCCSVSIAVPDRFERKVLKGGSHLCAPSYCRRYRPAARQPQTVDTSSCHIGFRCVRRDS